jgi:conserved hypothetical protein|nr:MAG TPA: tail assembly chaperone protein [Caudoviricetes sp.]
MNLVDELLKMDSKKADELKKGVFKSKRLASLLGSKEEAVDVTISEIPSRRLNDIISYQFNKNGGFDMSKSYDAKLILCTEACVEPDLMNKSLQAHFDCKNARELCEKLFGFEVNELSDEISALCGITKNENEEEEVKNL